MVDSEILTMLGPYGAVAVVAYLLGRVVLRLVGRFFERLIAALDRVGAKIDEHTAVDKEAHGEVREALGRLDARVTEIVDAGDRREQDVTRAYVARTTNPAVVLGSGGRRTLPEGGDDAVPSTIPRRKSRPVTAAGDDG